MMRKLNIYKTVLLTTLFMGLLFTAGAAQERQGDRQWENANEMYTQGDFAGALDLYLQIEQMDLESAKLYNNIGNSYYKQDSLGKAILYYKKALLLAPGDADIQHNLKVANARTINRITELPEFFLVRWTRSVMMMVSSDTWSILSLFFLGGSLTFCILYLLSSRVLIRKVTFTTGTVLLGLFVCALVNATWLKKMKTESKEAVVMSSAAAVKSSPDSSGTDVFVLNEGATLQVLSRLGEWSEIVIANGNKGWVLSKSIEMVVGKKR